MEMFTLNHERPGWQCNFLSEESYVLIKQVHIQADAPANQNLASLFSSIQIVAEMEYILYRDPQGRFVDRRTKTFPIHLPPDLYQVQPVVVLDLQICNEVFTIGTNPEEKCFQTLKIEWRDIPPGLKNCSLQFKYTPFQIS